MEETPGVVVDIEFEVEGLVVVVDCVAEVPEEEELVDPALHSLIVQSTPQVRNRSLRSTLPSTGWKLIPVTGPECPLYTSVWFNPAFAPARSYRFAE